jgi:uncharacterized lipoprotein
MSAKGKAQIGHFNYLPAQQGIVQTNQIENTAIGNLYFEKDIHTYYQTALFSEFRLVGVNVHSNKNIVEGNINKFLVDDLGYSIDWSLEVNYIVRDTSTNKVCYNTTKLVQKNTPKFGNVFGSLNEVMKLNIEKLLQDQKFRRCIR